MIINGFDTPNQLTQSVITQAKANNIIAAGRYISGGGSWKHLTQTEVNLCKFNDFALWLIDEGAGNAAQFATGFEGGKRAGLAAASIAKSLDVPSGIPIFVGVDYDAGQEDVNNIHAYMSGYASTCNPYVAGMYADGLIASQVPTSVGDFVPGAGGWNGTSAYLKSGKISLIQHPPTTMFGIDVDPVEIIDQSVLWRVGSSSGSGVQVNPTTNIQLVPKPSNKDIIKEIQKLLGVNPDGIFGSRSQQALTNLILDTR